MNLKEFVKQVQNKEIDIVEHTQKVLQECKKINKEYNYFNTISEDLALEQAKAIKKNPKGKLAGVAISIKDAICVKDIESTAGSIVAPASFCGVFGLCPTYGRISRYGLIDYGNSLDKIGPISKDPYDSALLLETISGLDEKDSTSLDEKVPSYTKEMYKEIKNLKIGVIKESLNDIDEKVSKKTWEFIKKLESLGCKYKEVSLPTTMKYGIQTYYLISTSEASTNLAKYSGLRYGISEDLKGDFNEYFTNVRSNNFGKEAKRRIMLGTFARMSGFRDAFYMKAAKVRTL